MPFVAITTEISYAIGYTSCIKVIAEVNAFEGKGWTGIFDSGGPYAS